MDNVSEITEISFDKKWFYQSVCHLYINDSLTDWIQDKWIIPDKADLNFQLPDFNQPI
jgi:hypothetical protein